MQHSHFLRGGSVLRHSHAPDPTFYPQGPSLADQAIVTHRRLRQLLNDMSPEQFIEYDKVGRAARTAREAGWQE